MLSFQGKRSLKLPVSNVTQDTGWKNTEKIIKDFELDFQIPKFSFFIKFRWKNWNIGAYYLNLILATRAKTSVSQLGSKFLKNIFAKLLHEK